MLEMTHNESQPSFVTVFLRDDADWETSDVNPAEALTYSKFLNGCHSGSACP